MLPAVLLVDNGEEFDCASRKIFYGHKRAHCCNAAAIFRSAMAS